MELKIGMQVWFNTPHPLMGIPGIDGSTYKPEIVHNWQEGNVISFDDHIVCVLDQTGKVHFVENDPEYLSFSPKSSFDQYDPMGIPWGYDVTFAGKKLG